MFTYLDRSSDDLKVIDISNPTSLSVVASLDIFEYPLDITISGNFAYIVDNNNDDLKVIDISNPAAPFLVNSITFDNSPSRIEVVGNYAYVAVLDQLKIIKLTCDMNIGYNPTTGEITIDSSNLADHTANTNIQLNDYYLSNDGDNEGISIDNDGNISLSGQLTVSDTVNLSSALIVNGQDLAKTVFTSENGITHSSNNDDDFIIGGDSLNYGGNGDEYKAFFDKSLAAFRAGRTQNTNWDETNLGLYSFATGSSTIATGNNAAAFGYQTIASGLQSFAGGYKSEATGTTSFALGREVTASSYGEIALGLYNTTYTPDDADDFDEDDRLFVIGNGIDDNNRSDAMVIYKNGDTEINGKLTLSGKIEMINTGKSIFIGEDAGENDNLSDNQNAYVGYQSGYTNTGGTRNTFMGYQSGYSNTGSSNTFMGSESGYSNTTGTANVFMGNRSGYANTTGAANIFLGNLSGFNNQTGIYNIFLGYWSGYNHSSGGGNIFIGAQSGMGNASGEMNVMIGQDAGIGNSGDRNIFIGYQAGYSETGSDKLYIDNSNTSSPLIYGEFDNDRVVINGNSSDNSNNRTLFVEGTIGSTSAFNNDSDRRLKTNIQTIPNALNKVLEMRGVTYQWKDGREAGDRMGFIAQEVEPILPEVVDNLNDHYTMQYAPITAVLVEAVKEQQAQIQQQQSEIEILKKRNQQLEQQVNKINALEAKLETFLKNQ